VKDATAAAPSVLKLIVIKISPNFLCLVSCTGWSKVSQRPLNPEF